MDTAHRVPRRISEKGNHMEKFIPFEKLSKKKQKELNRMRRGDWGTVNPATQVVPDKKKYSRKQKHKETLCAWLREKTQKQSGNRLESLASICFLNRVLENYDAGTKIKVMEVYNMHFWDKINVKELLIEDEAHTFPPFTEEELKQTEQSIGWKFPRSYLELLKIQNGGMINFDEFDESWLSAIYGISSKKGSIADMYDNWISEWEYPNIGIPFGETQSAGHDMYFMDFRMVDENGEPRIVLVDNEMGNSVTVVANNLEEFLAKVYHHEEVWKIPNDGVTG